MDLQKKQTTPVPESEINDLITSLRGSGTIRGLISHNEYIADVVEGLVQKGITSDNLLTLTDFDVKDYDNKLAELHANINKALAKQNALRSPITSAFNEYIVKAFTSSESRVKDAINMVVDARKKIASDINRRRDANAEKARKIEAVKDERIDYIFKMGQYAIAKCLSFSHQRIDAIKNKYYSVDKDVFDSYIKKLKEYNPILSKSEFMQLVDGYTFDWKEGEPSFATQEEMTTLHNYLDDLFSANVGEAIIKLLEAAPQRFLSNDEIDVSIPADAKGMIHNIIETVRDIAKMEVSFDTSAELSAAVQAKGTSEKKVLKPSTHAHWQLIIKSYMANDFLHLTMPEIEKMFSKMLTKANSVGNATGSWPAGVPVETDFTVRSKKQ